LANQESSNYLGWLVTRHRNDEARVNLEKIRGSTYTQDELDREMKEVIAFTEIESELEATTTFLDLFKKHHLSRTMIAFVLFTGQQLMGVGFLGG
jgi:recombinational DNA repair protein RecR